MTEKAGTTRAATRFIRDNAESLLTAIALALILRYFTLEAFKIPTGSMGVTLFGLHAWKACPNCDSRLPVAMPTDETTGRVTLPGVEDFAYERTACTTCARPGILYGTASSAPCMYPDCAGRLVGSGAPRAKARGFRGSGNLVGGSGFRPFVITCPHCRFPFHDFIDVGDGAAGDHLFVDKLYYKLIDPRRYDVIVFRFDREKNYIKRLVALGGETVDIRNGDLYVAPPGTGPEGLVIAPKPPAAQDAMLHLIHDSTRREKGYNPTPAWEPVMSPGQDRFAPLLAHWDPNAGVLDFNALPQPEAPPDATAEGAVRYARDCDDRTAFNAIRDVPPVPVGDRRLAFTASAVASRNGTMSVTMEDGPWTFEFHIPVDGAAAHGMTRITARETGAARIVAEAPGVLRTGRQTAVVIDNLDDALSVRLDGVEVCRAEVVTGSQPITRNTLRIQVVNAQVRLSTIGLWRDNYYRLKEIGIEGGFPYTVPQGDYFALGDNSPNSNDSRFWKQAPRQNLVGKALFVFWPMLPWDMRLGFIR